MNLGSYLPPSSGEAGAVFALLQVITDPAAAKMVLDKIAVEKAVLEKLVEKNNVLMDTVHEATKQNAEQAKTHADREKFLQQASEATDRRAQKVLAHEKDLVERENAHQKAAAELEGRTADLNVLHDALINKDKSLAGRESALATREKILAASVAKHQRWLETIKAPD